MSANVEQYIGFPPPLLGQEPVRLPVLYFREGLLALSQPAGVVSDSHPWYPDTPALVTALRSQQQAGKAELASYAIEKVQAIYFLEKEMGGVVLLGVHSGSIERGRNLFGSNQIRFKFHLLAESKQLAEDCFVCELPITAHRNESLALISHKTGKKASTSFQRIERLGAYDLWEISTSYLRPHQIRLHAMESGLKVVGEAVYSGVESIYFSQLNRRYRGKKDEKPIYSGACIWLSAISWQDEVSGESVSINSALPQKFELLLKKLRQVL